MTDAMTQNPIDSKKEVNQFTSLTLFELFEKQVDQNKEQIAIMNEQGTLTYEEVDHLSSQLARLLIEKGIGRQP